MASSKDLEVIFNDLDIPFISEYRFSHERKFRFDYCLMLNGFLVGIEYEGISFRNAQRSGHQSAKGYIKDCEKYNLAVSYGIPVLRYTCNCLKKPERIKKEILLTIKNKSKLLA